MQKSKDQIVRNVITLIGPNREQLLTMGTIKLPTYYRGEQLDVNFMVVDAPSSYNVLGRP